jgi:hypothetical protein
MSVCFIAGAIVKTLQVSAFTLVWTHSVQKTDWQEDWRASPDGLLLTEARVKGSGAGIDPPAEARLVDGWWRWRPQAVTRSEVILSQSNVAGRSHNPGCNAFLRHEALALCSQRSVDLCSGRSTGLRAILLVVQRSVPMLILLLPHAIFFLQILRLAVESRLRGSTG